MPATQSLPLRRQVLRRLMRRIRIRGLGPDDRLPPERELATELQVSRNTLREALKSLEAIGAITRRPKHGSILQPVDFSLLAEVSQALMLRTSDDFEELVIARCTFEFSMLPLIVSAATEEDFTRMEAANLLAESQLEARILSVESDLAFHLAMLHASHNRFLIQFGLLLQEFFRAANERIVMYHAGARRTIREHREIIDALRRKEIGRLQRLMQAHLDGHMQSARNVAAEPGEAPRRKTSRKSTPSKSTRSPR
jgi:GntR family transcriptional repressor for pyruvate dehydrogenase complex